MSPFMDSMASTSTSLPVTKATSIQFIDGNKLKSCRTGLTNHTWPISRCIMPLVINVLGGGHATDRQTDTYVTGFGKSDHNVTFCISRNTVLKH